MRSKVWAVAGLFFVLGVGICWAAVEVSAAEPDLSFFRHGELQFPAAEWKILFSYQDRASFAR